LQGNQLQYSAMDTPKPLIPGSAYAGAAMGNQLMNIGMTGLNNYINPKKNLDNLTIQRNPYEL